MESEDIQTTSWSIMNRLRHTIDGEPVFFTAFHLWTRRRFGFTCGEIALEEMNKMYELVDGSGAPFYPKGSLVLVKEFCSYRL